MGLFDAEPLRSPKLPTQTEAERSDTPLPPERLFDDPRLEAVPGEPLRLAYIGTGWAYFQVWIVVRLLTLLSLGFYAPWAKLRLEQHLAQHTRLGMYAVEVNFEPKRLLAGMAVNSGMLVLIFGGTLISHWLGGLLLFASMAVYPWVAAWGYAARWRRWRVGGIRLGALPDPKPLRKPAIAAGAISAALLVAGFELHAMAAKPWLWLIYIAVFMISAWLVFPRLSSGAMHLMFDQAHFGSQRVRLQAEASEVADHFIRQTTQQSAKWFGIVFGVLILASVAKSSLPGTYVNELLMLAIGVAGAGYGRARRLNYILNRLDAGGLSIVSKVSPEGYGFRLMAWAVVTVLTLGLAIPWVTVSMRSYLCDCIEGRFQGDWQQFAGDPPELGSNRADGLLDGMSVELM